MLRKSLAVSPLLFALALFGASLAVTPAQAQKTASGAWDAAAETCTCPDWNGCECTVKVE